MHCVHWSYYEGLVLCIENWNRWDCQMSMSKRRSYKPPPPPPPSSPRYSSCVVRPRGWRGTEQQTKSLTRSPLNSTCPWGTLLTSRNTWKTRRKSLSILHRSLIKWSYSRELWQGNLRKLKCGRFPQNIIVEKLNEKHSCYCMCMLSTKYGLFGQSTTFLVQTSQLRFAQSIWG